MANLTINGEINFTSIGAEAKATLLALLYPIGHIITVRNNDDYTNYLGGLWTKLPTDKVLWSASSVGTITEDTIEAGLPDIQGTIGGGTNSLIGGNTNNATINVSGAFTRTSGSVFGGFGSGNGYAVKGNFSFKASNYNSSTTVYGKSTTVQPPAIKAVMWQRIG